MINVVPKTEIPVPRIRIVVREAVVANPLTDLKNAGLVVPMPVFRMAPRRLPDWRAVTLHQRFPMVIVAPERRFIKTVPANVTRVKFGMPVFKDVAPLVMMQIAVMKRALTGAPWRRGVVPQRISPNVKHARQALSVIKRTGRPVP